MWKDAEHEKTPTLVSFRVQRVPVGCGMMLVDEKKTLGTNRHLQWCLFVFSVVIVTGFKIRLGLRVGYAGYGYGLDFADPH